PCLAHKASHEGVVAAETIAGLHPHGLNRARIPGCTYSHPQVASIGLTESAAAARGAIRVGKFPLLANGKAVAINDADGLIKTVFDANTGELLGAHMVGPGVTEMIQGFAVAIGLETTEAELMNTVFPHPTLSESMHEAVLAAYDRTINF
ncbi:MAG TPA: dihydrolipoyl dehydrogenase, partial [Gammaproteobacteria bacterium]|nr:dihydrolipoyl dehydrogenase [Gammaproteobacteria bacterium]